MNSAEIAAKLLGIRHQLDEVKSMLAVEVIATVEATRGIPDRLDFRDIAETVRRGMQVEAMSRNLRGQESKDVRRGLIAPPTTRDGQPISFPY